MLHCFGRVQGQGDPASASRVQCIKVTIRVDSDTAVEVKRVFAITDEVVVFVQPYNCFNISAIQPRRANNDIAVCGFKIGGGEALAAVADVGGFGVDDSGG